MIDWLIGAAIDEGKKALEREVRAHARRHVQRLVRGATQPVRDPVTISTTLESADGLTLEQREEAVREYLVQETIQVAILGSPGTGKTALMMRMADLRKRPTFVLGISQEALDGAGVGVRTGGWMRAITPEQLGAVPNGSDVLVDDASQVLGNDDYASEAAEAFRTLTENRRHWRIGLILNCQTGRSVNAYALTCELLCLKPGTAFFPEMEREGMSHLLREADAAFAGMSPEQVRHTVLVYRKWPRLRGPLRYHYPTWYTKALSENKSRRRLDARLAIDDSIDETQDDEE